MWGFIVRPGFARNIFAATSAAVVVLLAVPQVAVAAQGSPTFTSPASTTFVVGVPGSFQATATGTPLPTISRKAGAIPSSLTFSAAANSGVGTLSGTPVAGNGGVYVFKFRAVNGVPPSKNQSFTLTINEAPRFTSFASLSCASNTACNFTITTAGYPTNTNVALTSGTLPSGMAFTNNGNGTATLSGMPATAVGVVPLVFTATNSAGSATQNFTLTVNNYLAITSAATATCTAGSTCTFSVSARGTNTFALNGEVVHVALTSGALPSGLTFVDNNVCNSVADGPCNDTGTLSGTAVAGTGGVYQLQFTATDGSNDADAVQGFTLTVNEAPSFVSPDNITCIEVTANCDFDVSARGYPLPVLTQSGTLPSLLDGLAGANTTYSIFGVADAGTAGNYPLVFTASNGVGPAITHNFSLMVVTAANAGVVNTTLRGAGTGRVVSNPSGIDCPGSCSKTVAIGTPVALTATPTNGSVFIGWMGAGCSGNATNCTFNAAASNDVSATFAPAGTMVSLDVDASNTPTQYDAGSDGMMLLRYLLGYSAGAITADAHVATQNGRSPGDTVAYIDLIKPMLDIDGDGRFDAMSDGLLILRYQLGLRATALIAGATSSGATRSDSQIEALLQSLMP